MAGMPYIVTRGIVLRATETKETDKILTLLTAERGKLSVIARGVRRKSCRYAACAQPLAWSEWTLYQKGEWYYANEGSTLELFDGLRSDLDAMALGFYFAELTGSVTSEETAAPELLRHLLNGLYALSSLQKPPELVKPAFELKLLALAGYEPLADGCAYCGCPDPQRPLLDVVQGVLRCSSCGGSESGLSMPLCPDPWPRCGISCMEIPGGCMPSPWGRRRWGGCPRRRRPLPPPSWSAVFRHWTSTRASSRWKWHRNRILFVISRQDHTKWSAS